MARMSDISNWDGQDESVIPAVIRRVDTDIPEDHWDEFAEYAIYTDTRVWDAALDAMEQVYEEWKEETFCDECFERIEYDCECEEEEEEEEDDE
jgi:hypothetical protein